MGTREREVAWGGTEGPLRQRLATAPGREAGCPQEGPQQPRL